jgi:hypothetical protein
LLLPADAVSGISVVAALAALAFFYQNTSDGSSTPQTVANATLSLVEGAEAEFEGGESPPAGAPQGLARAMRLRRRVFALERELVTKERTEKQREDLKMAERQKSEARLMSVNHQLEERLKARTEELKRAGQKIIEAQRSVDDARGQLGERNREIIQLKYQRDQETEQKKNIQLQEDQHRRSLLRAAARESLMREKTEQRIEILQACLDPDAKAVAEALARVNDADPEQSSPRISLMIDQVETDFAVCFQRKQEQYSLALHEFQQQMERKKQEHNMLNPRKGTHDRNHYSSF